MTFLALDLLNSGVTLSMVCAGLGLLFAFFLIKAVIRLSPGNDRMRQIAGAVEEGAKAYLKRQVVTISAIAAVIFILLFIFRDKFTALSELLAKRKLEGEGIVKDATQPHDHEKKESEYRSSFLRRLRTVFEL